MKLSIIFTSLVSCISQYFPVYIALKQYNTEFLQTQLIERSNPHHENYGKWYSIDKIMSIVSPTEAEQNLVLEWIDLHKIQSKHSYGDAIKFYATKDVINNMFFMDKQTTYNIPQHLQNIIEFVEMSSKQIKRNTKRNVKTNNSIVDESDEEL